MIGRFTRGLRPRSIDLLLYSGEKRPHPVAPPQGLLIAKYTFELPSGDMTIDRRLSPRRTCYVASCNGSRVHESWIRYDVQLPQQFGYGCLPVIGDCVTRAEFRGKRIFPTVLQHILNDMDSPEAYILVSPDNVSSVRGIERAGFQFVERLRGIRVGPLLWKRRAKL